MDLAVLDAEAAAPRPDVAPRPQRPAGAAHPAAAAAHTPVLLERCLDLLAGALEGPGAPERPVMIDCTLGAGGHAEGALRRFPALSVVGIDRDPEAIALAGERLAPFGRRFRAVRTTYDRVDAVAREASVRPDGTVDAVLMDLGVSSLQLDDAGRGFSYARPAPLDMRMDQSGGTTAQQILDTADERELTRILRAVTRTRPASEAPSPQPRPRPIPTRKRPTHNRDRGRRSR